MTLPAAASPFSALLPWLKDAEAAEPNDPFAACLSTLAEDGTPDSRIVLIRSIDENGFTFYTNYNSQKGRQLTQSPAAALCFHWKSLRRQVRVRGHVVTTTPAQADAYYQARPLENRIGAWASLQSETLPDRSVLLERYSHYKNEFAPLNSPPRPPHWGGFCLTPHAIELWQEGEGRLHERRLYEYDKNKQEWCSRLLYP